MTWTKCPEALCRVKHIMCVIEYRHSFINSANLTKFLVKFFFNSWSLVLRHNPGHHRWWAHFDRPCLCAAVHCRCSELLLLSWLPACAWGFRGGAGAQQRWRGRGLQVEFNTIFLAKSCFKGKLRFFKPRPYFWHEIRSSTHREQFGESRRPLRAI